MKKSILIFCFYFPLVIVSQTIEVKQKPKIVEFENEFFLFASRTSAFGDNFIAKAHKPSSVGFGAELKLFQLYKIGFVGGFHFISFDVSDKALASNATTSNTQQFFGKLNYNLNLQNDFRLQPYFGVGEIRIATKNGNQRLGSQEGTVFLLGTNFIYDIDNTFAVFFGAEYQLSKMNTITNPEFDKFFNNLQQINFRLGITLR